MDKCKFCGSKDTNPKTPYIDGFKQPVRTFCCGARKTNYEHAKKKYGDEALAQNPKLVDEVSSL